MKMTFRLYSLLLLLLASINGMAKVKLPYFFADNMVLQQQTNAAIWGWAKPGGIVSIQT